MFQVFFKKRRNLPVSHHFKTHITWRMCDPETQELYPTVCHGKWLFHDDHVHILVIFSWLCYQRVVFIQLRVETIWILGGFLTMGLPKINGVCTGKTIYKWLNFVSSSQQPPVTWSPGPMEAIGVRGPILQDPVAVPKLDLSAKHPECSPFSHETFRDPYRSGDEGQLGQMGSAHFQKGRPETRLLPTS